MQQYQDIKGRTGFTNLVGTSGTTYGNARLLTASEATEMVADGITEWTAPTKPIPSDAYLLEQAKVIKKHQIRSGYDYYLSLPFGVNGILWDAGFDSASRLNDAVELATFLGLTEVTFYDSANASHAFTLLDAKGVSATIAIDNVTQLGIKNSLYGEVNNALDLAAIELITIPDAWVQPGEFF